MSRLFQRSILFLAGFVSAAVWMMWTAGPERSAKAIEKVPALAADLSSPDVTRDERHPQIAFQAAAPAAAKTPSPAEDRGWVGMMLEDVNAGGIRVTGVFPGGPAAFAGVRSEDMLIRIGNTAPANVDAAIQTIEALPVGQPAKVTVSRNGRELTLQVLVGSLVSFHRQYVGEMTRRDPRDPNYTRFHGVSPADMQVEMTRRLFEQNERLERSLATVVKELAELRKEVQALRK